MIYAMKATYEHVDFGDSCSLRVYHRQLPCIPFEWHHHPEYELTLTLNSQGQRYIGDSIANYGDEDLVLVPPDLPHTWTSNRSIDTASLQTAIVIWFTGDWARRLADICPEYAPMRTLLRRAACGLAFAPEASAMMRGQAAGLLSRSPRERLSTTLDILCALASASGEPLASPNAFKERADGPSRHEPERINRVLSMIDKRFAEPLRLSELSQVASVSERSLARYFEQHIGESIGRYITRLRIGHACRLLASTLTPVSVVAARSGFPNVSHFNRQFKAMKALTPIAYRKQFTTGNNVEQKIGPDITERPASLRHEGRPPAPFGRVERPLKGR